MMKKICPICDLPVSEINYCSCCKKFVRRPVIQNVDYYLNENHPDKEIDCDFHNPPQIRPRYEGNRQQPPVNPGGNRKSSVPQGSGQPLGNRGPQVSGNRQPKKPAPNNGKITMLVTILTIVMFSIAIIGNLAHNRQVSNNIYKELADNVYEAPINDDDYSGYDYDYDYDDYGEYDLDDYYGDQESYYSEFTDEEVIEAGLECTGYYHFPIAGSQIVEEMNSYINSQNYGYTVERDFYTSNVLEEESNLTYYDQADLFMVTDALAENDFDYQYIGLYYDTVSGNLHDYGSALYNDEASLDYLKYFLETIEEYAEVGEADSKIDEIMELAEDSIANKRDELIMEGLFYIDIECQDAMVYIYVEPNL